MQPNLIAVYLRWAALRAALARGWWLVTALYLVVAADLSAAELVLLGTFQAITVIVAEVPAGVLADAVGRRLALVLAHVVMGAGMALTGFVTGFVLLIVAQCLWGLGWALSSGADVAWITDELDRTDLIDRVLAGQARRELFGTAAGIVTFGALAWSTTLPVAIVAAGTAMILLGLLAVARWPETRPTSVAARHRGVVSTSIFRRAIVDARANRVILLVLAATLLVNGGAEGFGRLFEQRLVALGLPEHPEQIVWFALLALFAVALGATFLRLVEARIDGSGVAVRVYVTACFIGAGGLALFAHAPNTAAAVAGSLLVSGISLPTVRVVATILVNRRAMGDVRATVHSLLSQAENVGELIFGLGLAAVAAAAGSALALTAASALVAVAGLVVSRAAGAARSDELVGARAVV